MNNLFFLHGLKGSSQGTKSLFLKKYFPDCIIPDFSEDMHQRMNQLKPLVKSPAWLVGSSMGGLQALFFANFYPNLVKGMVLIAPAVGFFEDSWCSASDLERIKSLIIPENIPCTILAGLDDDVIPMNDIEALIDRSQKSPSIKLLKLEDDHQLNQSLEILLKEIKLLIEK
jgi:hypothetical protein